ncbi:GNAT family N-acetyltransferase [Amycolatopsis sp. YIM 10]|uniref:GNAT family N-acetyltransferase n=1 Tax=Amycolatopsis sp. YIM 10 TaxID=2653857 RepID=UPI00128FF34D|nr:hypothetical protein [Amycolatopsis sp. YIM 10]QFU89750.1 hypothetical protein YIM_22865 [Amycolatopsis sp. YIM 10]
MLFPHTESSRVALRPASVEDAPKAYDILFRLGYGGLPVIDEFTDSFGRGLSACFMLQRADDGEQVGVSTISDLNSAGHVRAEINVGAGQPEEIRVHASALTTNIAFAMWRTRKVYFHTVDPDAGHVGFGPEHSAMVRAEAVLRDYTFFHGRVWDINVFSVYREDWDEHGVDLLKQIV